MDAPPTDSAPPPENRPRRRRRLYAAPRRFDLATVFVVTTAYALLLGGMSALGAHPALTAIVASFITMVAIGQATLFGGNRPRLASMLVGVAASALALLVEVLSEPPLSFPSVVLLVLVASAAALVYGTVLGYLAGALVGGVFLVADLLRRRY